MYLSLPAMTRRPHTFLLVSLASAALFTSGCSNLTSTALSSGNASTVATVGGRVHGGNQPVAGATVKLYFAGQGGIASAATLAATTTTADDGAGSFSFNKGPDLPAGGTNPGNTNTFSCPSGAGTPYVYLVARGGNTLNTHDASVNNSASVFLAPVGLCTSINSSTFTYMSEAVTAATVAAVHQFMNVATDDIGADGILASYDALANSFNTVSNMVSLSTGQTLASKALTGPASGITITASPEQAKLNQIANILSACVNNATSTATACGTLFSSAVPPVSASTTSTPAATFAPATDVLQAAFYMFTNGTDTNSANLTKLYNLSPASGAPYQPTLPSLPSDWSIGIQYAASGTCGPTGGGFISIPYDLNVDGTGNIWIANGQTGNGTLSQISSTGLPLTCIPIPGGSRGGTIDSGTGVGTTRTNGSIWIADSENNMVYRYNTDSKATLAFPTTTLPFAMAADGNGNVYYSTITPASVWMIPAAASAPAAVPAIQISSTVGPTPARLLVDGKGAIWVSSGDNVVSQITPITDGAPNQLNGYSTVQFTTPAPSYGLAANPGTTGQNGIYVSSQDPANQIDLLVGTGVTYQPGAGFPTASNAGGLNTPSSIALDGAQNVWAANDQSPSDTTPGVVSQISAAGVSLSPDGTSGGYQKDRTSFINGRSIAVDQGGNVWVGRDGSNLVTEIVGAAVPVFQPFALGLATGRFQTIP
ncbi:MAG: hypothetical protein NVSMB3_01110 [Acidobacteriaceae bacterium]